MAENKEQQKKEKIFVSGLVVDRPHEKAPDFIKLSFGANVDSLVEWLQQYRNPKGWVNFDLKKSQKGKLYLELNTYKRDDLDIPDAKPKNETQEGQRPNQARGDNPPPVKDEDIPEVDLDDPEVINPDEIPF